MKSSSNIGRTVTAGQRRVTVPLHILAGYDTPIIVSMLAGCGAGNFEIQAAGYAAKR